MNPIDLIVTVCAVLSPTTCEDTHLVFSYSGSLTQCVMAAPPYIAQWVGDHPKWTAVKWRCEYPHTNDKADAGKPDARGLNRACSRRAICCSPSDPCPQSKTPRLP